MTLLGSLRYFRHELLLFRRVWWGSAFSTFIAPLLYLAGIGLGVGSLVQGPEATAALGGATYAAFAGTGLLAASSMLTGIGDMSWPVYGTLTFTRTWSAATATPLAPGDVVGGVTLLLVARLAVANLAFGLALRVFGLIDIGSALRVVAPGMLVGLACGLPMFAFAAATTDSARISYVFRFLVVPLFILSGTFLPISRLPEPVQVLAVLSPLWHGVELVRSAGLGQQTTYPPVLHVAILVVLLLAGGALAARTLRRRLQP